MSRFPYKIREKTDSGFPCYLRSSNGRVILPLINEKKKETVKKEQNCIIGIKKGLVNIVGDCKELGTWLHEGRMLIFGIKRVSTINENTFFVY